MRFWLTSFTLVLWIYLACNSAVGQDLDQGAPVVGPHDHLLPVTEPVLRRPESRLPLHSQQDQPVYSQQDVMDLIDARLEEYAARRSQEAAARQPAGASPSAGTDPTTVARGQAAFNSFCTSCHDAERSLQKRKSFDGWLATVRRMAAKDDADIASSDVVPIAQYLTSVRGVAQGDGASTAAAGASSTTLQATISLLERTGNHELELEKPGFFVDAWVGADWQSGGPLSATVTACTSCHSDRNPSAGFTVELVEAAAKVDLMQLCCGQDAAQVGPLELSSQLKAGRFIAPFGAFAAMSHPGIYQTATNPLMFIMGRRVGPTRPLQPVLPAPFSDEGVNVDLTARMGCDWSITMDAYAINGLQAGGATIFNDSRRYYDNNREPFVGGRLTVGNSWFRFGGSLMSGSLHDDQDFPLYAKLSGADFTARWEDRLRFYFEYAIRTDDSAILRGTQNHAYGVVFEGEVKVWDKPDIRLLARYDTLEHRDAAFGEASTDRFTWGINTGIIPGSMLILNHEHWMFESQDYDVVALRWVAAF